MPLMLPSFGLLMMMCAVNLPPGFVELAQVAPSIEQDMRYASTHNFTGKKAPGYGSGRCVLTAVTAQALEQAQKELNIFGLGIKVYDCYRPERAVHYFSQWALSKADVSMSQEFFPGIDKNILHSSGYIAHRSGHSRGSTVDLTLVRYPAVAQPTFTFGEPLKNCTLPANQRFADNSLDMGTGFDCFDPRAHTQSANISAQARINRLLLRQVMRRYGLINYPKEWWHYTFYAEPFKNKTFDFSLP